MSTKSYKEEGDEEYQIIGVVSSTQVPNWARRPPKWRRLMDAVLALKPGQSLTVVFASKSQANRARNTVRDSLNMTEGQALFRTRIVPQEDGKALAYFSRLHPSDVVEEHRETPKVD